MENADIKTSSLEEARALRDQGKTKTRTDAPRHPVNERFWEHAEAGKRLIESAEQALAFAEGRGDAAAYRVHIPGSL